MDDCHTATTDMARTPGGYRFDWVKRNRLMATLALRAPHADTVLIAIVAGLLAGSACSDALLIAADAIEEQCGHLASTSGDFAKDRASMRVLIDALRDEAPAHAANELFPVR